jgi:hypothetical protein
VRNYAGEWQASVRQTLWGVAAGRREFGAGLRGLGALSENAEQDIAQAARWAARWRELEREALQGRVRADPEAQRYMLFISEGYRLLAERAESRETVAQEAYE